MLAFRSALALTMCLGAPVFSWAGDGDYKEVKWEELVPSDTKAKSPLELATPMHNSPTALAEDLAPDEYQKEMKKQQLSATVRDDMKGRLIKIAGFTVPLQTNEEGALTEFFLVPFMGACIHVPPPPTNQIIHVSYEKGYKLPMLSSPVWVYGKLEVDNVQTEIADSGYNMQAEKIEDYSGWY